MSSESQTREKRATASTIASVMAAIANSPIAPTRNGRIPCFIISRIFVRSPTPAKVSRKAQRERLAMSAIWDFEKNPAVVSGRDQKKSQHELRKFLPQEARLIVDHRRLRFACPIDRVPEDDKTDRGIPGGLGEHGEFPRGVGKKRAGRGGLCRIVHRKARPQAESLVAHAEGVANRRERKQAEGAQAREWRRSRRRLFIVGVNGSLGGDDGGDAADRRSDGEQAGEFGR